MRSRWVKQTLENLDVTKATGPDGIGARMLKLCAGEIAFFYKPFKLYTLLQSSPSAPGVRADTLLKRNPGAW